VSIGRDRLPAGIALGHIRVIACGIGTIVPSLRRIGLVVTVISIVRIIAPPGISEESPIEKPVIAKSIAVEPAIAISIPVEPIAMESAKSARMDATRPVKSAAVKAAHSAAVEPAHSARSPAMGPSIGEIWLAERGSAQQTNCDCKSPRYPAPGPMFG
jgi:hypothetical protein